MLWLPARRIVSRSLRWLHISALELTSEFQGTRLGVAWLPLSNLIFVTFLTLVFHQSGSVTQSQFFLYVLAGNSTWVFIAATINQGGFTIQRQLEFAAHNGLSLGELFIKTLFDRLIVLVVNLLVCVVFSIMLTPGGVSPSLVLLIPLALMGSLLSISLAYLVNYVTLVVPDIGQLISSIVRFLFFATPIFWVFDAQSSGVQRLLATYNPISYFLGATRQALAVEPVNLGTWLVAGGITLATAGVAAVLFRLTRDIVRNLR